MLRLVTKTYHKCPNCGKSIIKDCPCGYKVGDYVMTKDEKQKFRKSTKWRAFRKRIYDMCPRDTITRKLLRRDWNLHHLDMNDKHYTDLSDTKKFTPLNKDTHEFVHWLFRYYRHDKKIIDRLKKLMEAMYEYIEGSSQEDR